MSQQLNLLSTENEGLSPAVIALLVLGFVVLALLVAYGVKQAMLSSARNAEIASAAQLKEVSAQLRQKIQVREDKLNAEIAALKPKATESEQVLKLAATLGRVEGYSPYFSTLATVRESGVWVTSATVSKAGKSFKISGQSLDKDAVIRYTQRLNAALATSDIQLSSLEMTTQPLGSVRVDEKRDPATAIKFTLQ